MLLFFVGSSVLPFTAEAQWGRYLGATCPKPPNNFKDFVCISMEIISLTTVFAASSAFLAFIWGLSKFIYASGNEEKVADGKMIMKWGLIGLFFMVSIWGVLFALTTGLGLDYGIPLLPQTNFINY